MKDSKLLWARTMRLVLLFAAVTSSWTILAGTPAITGIAMGNSGPQFSILSVVGATNQIQSTTDLALSNWVVVTSLVVTQSPYTFVDTLSPRGPQRYYRVIDPHSGVTNSIPQGMVLIPAGTFQMGDTFNEGESYEVPVHPVYVSAFYMDKYEVTKALWDQVHLWSLTNGYTYDYPGSGKAPNHPVQSMDWYDAAKWCNARCEKEKRTPCYYTDAALTQVYRSGLAEPYVNWKGAYRLPTEAEWEKGDRGGASGHRFPWTNVETISHSQANYYSDSTYSFDVSPTRGFNPAFVDGVPPYTAPVGSFAPNGYGLYDTAGNVWEWCWDYAGAYPSTADTDPHGPTTGSTRIGRGGNWDYYAVHCRDAYRYGNPPTHVATNIGFRCALSAQ